MDRRIRWLGVAFLALFALLFGQVNYLQVYAADRLANDPANHRLLLQEYDVRRGTILARDQRTVLARSVSTTGQYSYRRVYPHGGLYGQITGYNSLLYGRSGLEAAYNDYLSGRATALSFSNVIDALSGRPKQGASLITTIDPLLQRTASKALGNLPGGVVALDPSTGQVLAMVSNPTYDPSPLASPDTSVETKAWRRLTSNPSKPLVARAFQELYPPGSTFKTVTASADLMVGATPQTTYPNPHELDLPQTVNTLQNFGNEWCLGGAPRLTLDQALTVSCNVVFGEIGLHLGADRLVSQARAFGFDANVPFDLPFAEGQIPPADSFAQDQPGVAYSAIGQQSVTANPLQMALVAAAIANGGVEMRPYLVTQIRDASGRVVRSFAPQPLGQPITSGVASEMTSMMVNVVAHGTGTAAQIPGVQVAGKTGTAQHGEGKPPHAWFVSFAPAQAPKVVVAVVVLDGGDLGSEATGGRVAAPIAKAVMQAALGE